jgi:tRNA1(Val) A37 N6-methylase TrmN6
MDDNKQYSQKLHGKRVLELGAGCGLAGIYCSLKVPKLIHLESFERNYTRLVLKLCMYTATICGKQ